MTISFKVSKADRALIGLIAARAVGMAASYDVGYDRMTAEMDLIAVHANGNALRLKSLLDADDFNFAHDIFGIRNCLNRETGELENLFSPRFTDSAYQVEQESKRCKDCRPDVALRDEHSRRLTLARRSDRKFRARTDAHYREVYAARDARK